MSTVKKIQSTEPPFQFEAYAHVISPIPKEDGGGYMLSVPDIPGCMADGETELEAIENGRDAFLAVVSTLADMGRPIPAPTFTPEDAIVPDVSGKFVARVPKFIHAKLATRAKAEGVSLNTLVVALISEGLGNKEAHA